MLYDFFFFFLIFFWPEGKEKICQHPPVTRNFCHNYDVVNASDKKKILCFCKNDKQSLIAGNVIVRPRQWAGPTYFYLVHGSNGLGLTDC